MFSVVRSVRAPTLSPLFSSNPHKIINKTSIIRFAQAAAGPEKPVESDEMDKQNKEQEAVHKGDTMSHSFGEAYSTRSEEEGFGGTYGQNQSLSKEDEDDKVVHEEQGSEVKEKERGRNQKNVTP